MGVPKLRFKADDGSDFPDWTFRTFGSVVEEFNDRTTTENEDVLLSCAIDGVYLNSELFGHQRGASNIGYKKITKGALILSMQNLHLGNANVNTRFEHGIVSPAYKTFHIVGCLTEFMSAWVKRHAARKFFYDATTVGASQCRRNVDWEELYQQTIAVPSPSEQRKIADLLSAVDDVISAQEAEVAAWEKRKKGVMQKLFSQEVRFRADDGSDFPDWEEKTLGEEGQFYGGLSGKGKDDFDCGNGRFVTYMNVYKNTFASRDAMGRVKVGDAEKQNKVRYGDILFTQSSETVDEVGLSSVYLYNDEPYLNSFCMGYRFNNLDNVCPEFIGYCMRSNEIRKSIMLMGQGISRINLGAKRLATVKYKIPSLPEQRKIADCLSSMDEVIQKAKDELAKWRELKKGLLQQMFV